MENCHSAPFCLELTIGFSSSSFLSPGESTMKELDINQVPSSGTEEECMEEEEEGESPNGGPARRKKLRLTKEQSRLLEESFKQNHTLNPREKETLAEILSLKPRQVEVWFQNRRARSKLKQTEMECEYLKRWFGSLSEQNRKLHKEVEELRAINVHGHGHLPPPASALSMCPRCERVTAAANTKMSHLRHRQPPAACFL
ncbi:homeobox-leucine zipper protein HOX3-like [Salvia miltiorrhiza]|uniref:homeobox-leucine zipper protein HOX3-like n=1 Tax=Salvia miltiorrhiza TaxID=226208 RepID=UPI0025AC701C|nr:homeobox-leucine zipper protein HOX3-like [Salvia miltiorrhiza]WGS99087.1 HD-Zip22 protein [Salvia miltiorrhiza]